MFEKLSKTMVTKLPVMDADAFWEHRNEGKSDPFRNITFEYIEGMPKKMSRVLRLV